MDENTWIKEKCSVKCDWFPERQLWHITVEALPEQLYFGYSISPVTVISTGFGSFREASDTAFLTFKFNLRTKKIGNRVLIKLNQGVRNIGETHFPVSSILQNEGCFEDGFESISGGNSVVEEEDWPNLLT